jgi:hypothetical protein
VAPGVRSLRGLGPGTELECVRAGFSKDAEVLLGTEVVGTLEPVGFFGMTMEVASGDGSWTIARRGWLSSTHIVTERARDVEAARREGGAWRGSSRIVFPDGRDYEWKKTRFWRMNYAVLKNGVPVLSFTPKRAWFTTRLMITVEPGARSAEHDLPILILFGCHLLLAAIAAAQAAA